MGLLGYTTHMRAKYRFKRPESVLVLVYLHTGEVLLLRRTRPPDFWQSITGSLEWGETALHAAHRELYEETGLRVGKALEDCRITYRFPILPAWRARYGPRDRFNTEYLFKVELNRRRFIRLNPREHLNYRWLPWSKAAQLVFSWTNRDAILKFVRPAGGEVFG